MATVGVFILILVINCSCSRAPRHEVEPAIIATLRAFSGSSAKDRSDEAFLIELHELTQKIKDEDLEAVERFALTDEAKHFAGSFVRLLVERQRFDSAAKVVVHDMLSDKAERQYRMWKWWEYSFGEREDYDLLSRRFTDALLRKFRDGILDEKVVISELFGKTTEEAKLSLELFKRAIKYDGN